MSQKVYETVQLIGMICLMALFLFAIGRMIFQSYWDKNAPVKTTKAKVVDKFKNDRATKIYGSMASKTAYYVVFDCGGKKRSFRVSEFSYGGYRIGETGTLKYQGKRLIDFH